MYLFRLLLPMFLGLVFWGSTSAQTVPPKLDSLLNHTLDSMRTVLNVKSLGAALQLSNGAVWAGAKGISTSLPLANVTPAHTYCIGSVTKTITSACVLQLADEGILNLDDSLYEWLDTFPYINPNITIRQLLRHQSGIYDVITDADYNDASVGNIDSIWDIQTMIEDYIHPPLFAAGTGWSYSNTNYALLGLIIEKATGHTYYDEYRTRFFTPLNLTSAALPPYDPLPAKVAHLWLDLDGNGTTEDAHSFFSNWYSFYTSAGPMGGYYATPTDVAVWMRAFLSGSLHSSDIMAQAKVTVSAGLPNGTKYGLGIMERKFLGLKAYGHGGDIGYSATSYYFPEKDISISVLNNDGKSTNTSWKLGPVVQALLKTYLDCEAATSATNNLIVNALNIETYPNPFMDAFDITMQIPVAVKVLELTMTNISGVQVARKTTHNIPVGTQKIQLNNLAQLPSGVYAVQVIADGKMLQSVKVTK